MSTKRAVNDDVSDHVRAAFADLDRDHLAFLATLSATRRLYMVGELADFARESYAMQVRRARPDASHEELWAEVRRRMWQRDDA